MSNHKTELALRREALLARSAAQRDGLTADWEAIVAKTAVADRLVATVRNHPLILGAAAAGVMLLGSRKFFDVTQRLLTLYLLLRRASRPG